MKTRLELAAVTKSFGAQRVLNQVWLQIRASEAVGLIGSNGAGKTTLLRIAAGLVRPDGGCVQWADARPALRYFGGEVTLPPDVAVRRWASLFALPMNDRRRIGQLSRGNRQLVGLRLVLSGSDADILLLDEPWEGLDPDGSEWLTETLRRWRDGGAAVLISSHRFHDLDSVCTRFVMLERGRCRPVTAHEQRPRVDQLVEAFSRRSGP
jgi:ABC-type multidrug transport system ATPase subunit